MHYTLTEEQKAHWKKHRFLKITDYYTATEIAALADYSSELIAWPEMPGLWMKYYENNLEGKRQLCRVEHFLEYHSGLDELARGERVIDLLSQLMGEKAVIFKEKLNVKLPGGNGFTPHQDAPAFVSFKQTYHITMMVAVDPSTRENGCLQLLHNDKHAGITLAQEADGSIDKKISDGFQWHYAECNPGDILLFDSYLPHYSEPNRSDKSRRALYITYNREAEGGSRRTDYFQDKREKFPPDCERIPGKDYSQGAEIYNVANPIGTTG